MPWVGCEEEISKEKNRRIGIQQGAKGKRTILQRGKKRRVAAVAAGSKVWSKGERRT